VLNANLLISNVPGPREPQYVNGARLEAAYTTSMLLAGQALNITVVSHADNLDMGILACPDLCPSPQRIAVYAGEEIAVLEAALGLKPPRRTAARRAAGARAAAGKAPAGKAEPAARKAPAGKAPPRRAGARKAAVGSRA
jgi:hypothetical protein